MNSDYRSTFGFRDTLREILKIISDIETFTDGMSQKEFVSDPKTVAATTYALLRLSKSVYAIGNFNPVRSNIPVRKLASISRWLDNYKQKLSPSVIWQTIQDDMPQVAKGFRKLARENEIDFQPQKSSITRIKLISPVETSLTSISLQSLITPYLNALTDLQNFVNEVLHRAPANELTIKFITQNSPINVGINGAVEATQLIQETIIPWKREHAQSMAKLLEHEKMVEIEKKRAEVLQTRALAAKERIESDRLRTEINLQLEQTEKLHLENEALRFEIKRKKIELAFEILNKLNLSLDEKDKVGYLMRLLPIIDILTSSELEMTK